MERFGLLVLLKAREGKEKSVEEFLQSAQRLVLQEEGTLRWYAFKTGLATFGIFDTFPDSESRLVHLKGEVAKALLANADQLLAVQPEIQMFDVVASHTRAERDKS